MKVLLIILFVALSLVFLFLVFVVIAAFYSGYQVKKSGGEAWWERDERIRMEKKYSRRWRNRISNNNRRSSIGCPPDWISSS